MGTLSGQTIQSTYKGLLKLADSTTGITNTYQEIQDGLGNNTGIKIKNNYIFDNAHQTKAVFKPRSLGPGLNNTAQLNHGNVSNYLIGMPFWDSGQYSYSSLTVNVRTITTTSDVLTAAFYSSQMTSNGILPKDLVMSGITIPTNILNQVTVTLPSNLTFSATPGINYIMLKISNAGVTPTIRISGQATTVYPTSLNQNYGLNKTGTLYYMSLANTLSNSAVGNVYGFSGLTNFQTGFSESTIVNAQSPIPVAVNLFGFLLNVI